MELSQNIITFLSVNLHKTRAEYYLNFFGSMTEYGFKERIKKYCHTAHENEKKHFLGNLNTDSLVLLLTMRIIENSISRKKCNISSQGEVSIYASEKDIDEERKNYEDSKAQIGKAATDYWKTRERLYENIKESFDKELSLLLKATDLLERAASFEHQIPGYDFVYDGQGIYVINWYPIGGD